MSAAGIAAVVVTYQSAGTIGECLERLRAAGGVAQIRVVDNGSSDGTMAIVQRQAAADPRLRFIANPDNPGFGAACNQGVAAVDAAAAGWIALVNPDLMVEPDTLARLVALGSLAAGGTGAAGAVEASRAVGGADSPGAAGAPAPAGVGSDDARGRAERFAGGAAGTVADPEAVPPSVLLGADLIGEDGVRDPAARRRDPDFAAMLRALLPGSGRAAAQLAIPPDDALELQPVQAVSGALMLMPRALYERLGGFDEGYRLHAEDLDLCRRARLAGAVVAVANRVRVLHVRGVSSRARPVFVEWHKHRGLARYFRKFEAPRRAWPLRILIPALIWARFPFAALSATHAGARHAHEAA